MIQIRLLTFALLATEAVVFGLATDTVIFPVVIAVGAAVAVSGLISFPLAARWKTVILVAVAIGFFIRYQVAPFWAPMHQTVFPVQEYAIMHAITQFMLVAQVIEYVFPARQPEYAHMAPSFGVALCSVVAMVCILNFVAVNQEHRTLLAPMALFALLLVVYLASVGPKAKTPYRSRIRFMFAAGILSAGLALGCLGAAALYGNINELDRLFARLLMPMEAMTRAGFSRKASLSSVKEQKDRGSHNVALRVEIAPAANEPGYLRGLAFDTYNGKEWVRSTNKDVYTALPPVPSEVTGTDEKWFSLREGSDEQTRVLTIWPDNSISDVLFLPLETLRIGGPLAGLQADTSFAVDSVSLPRGASYRAVAARPFVPVLSEEDRTRYTALPELDSRISELATSVCDTLPTARAKANAVEDYFLSNYQYHVGMFVPPLHDPLTYFLLARPPSHCEFFAAGAAVLLRLSGVPCRYVTGFVVAEPSPMGDYWIARNKDAHAWVEAWDDETGWFIVEGTPGTGVPSAQDRSWLRGMWDAIKFKAKKLKDAFSRRDMSSILELAKSPPAGWSALAIVVVGCIWLVIKKCIGRTPRDRVSLEIIALRRQLKTMDRKLGKQGLQRNQDETIWQFAERLEAGDLRDAAKWYRQYALRRYGQEKRGTHESTIIA